MEREGILVRGVNWVGDAVMTIPAIRAIHRARKDPGEKVSLLAKPWVSGLFEKDPDIDEIILYEDRFSGIGGRLALSSMLRKKRFRSAVLLQNAFDAALITFLAGIPERMGYARDGRMILLTKKIPFNGEDRKLHHTDYYLNLLREMGIPAEKTDPWIFIDIAERLRARGLLKVFKRPVIGLNPGAVYGSSKRWPPSKFRELAGLVINGLGGSVAVFGSQKEAPIAGEIVEGLDPSRAVSFAGRTNLRELAALVSECDALVSNDSGTMHIGYAVGTPVVALFGSTSPELTGPPEDGNVVVKKALSCAPCFKRECPGKDTACMEGIGAEEVFVGALKGVLPGKKAVFFDRDGTLCREANYLNRWQDFEPFKNLSELQRLKRAGFRLVGITNQSGIKRGIIREEFVNEVHDFFAREHGFDAFYYCPHHPDDHCSCRKPSPGMLFRARRDMGIDLKKSFMIGDRQSDMLTAKAAGARGIFIKTGVESSAADADFSAGSLKEAVDYIIRLEAEKDGK
ncbi:MAG: lipopolysaccharide heptosyltransferase II [Nitrospiraceae bacterium]|nr:lipopolysaccharide heptosyltransferase II [Nitrospiraceae bacterium]